MDEPKIITQVNGERMDVAKEIAKVKTERMKREFIKDNGCYGCDYFDRCIFKITKKGFSCPLEDTNSAMYYEWMVNNFHDLCVVLEEPTAKEWKSVEKETDNLTLYAMGKLKVRFSMPKVEIFKKFQEQYGVKTVGNNVEIYCSVRDLHRRLVELLKYKSRTITPARKMSGALVRLLIPIHYWRMFAYEQD